MKEITETEAYSRLTAYLARAEHCCAEVTLKLQHWGIDCTTIEHLVQRLVDEGYIDDERYCRAFVRDKFRLDHWGKQKIAQALKAKNIPSSTYLPCLREIPLEEYLATLRALLAAKQRSVHATTELERRNKLIRFALGRGYEMGEILETMDHGRVN